MRGRTTGSRRPRVVAVSRLKQRPRRQDRDRRIQWRATVRWTGGRQPREGRGERCRVSRRRVRPECQSIPGTAGAWAKVRGRCAARTRRRASGNAEEVRWRGGATMPSGDVGGHRSPLTASGVPDGRGGLARSHAPLPPPARFGLLSVQPIMAEAVQSTNRITSVAGRCGFHTRERGK